MRQLIYTFQQQSCRFRVTESSERRQRWGGASVGGRRSSCRKLAKSLGHLLKSTEHTAALFLPQLQRCLSRTRGHLHRQISQPVIAGTPPISVHLPSTDLAISSLQPSADQRRDGAACYLLPAVDGWHSFSPADAGRTCRSAYKSAGNDWSLRLRLA
jgi:hypothetical protein